jgi:hypothetical protein
MQLQTLLSQMTMPQKEDSEAIREIHGMHETRVIPETLETHETMATIGIKRGERKREARTKLETSEAGTKKSNYAILEPILRNFHQRNASMEINADVVTICGNI